MLCNMNVLPEGAHMTLSVYSLRAAMLSPAPNLMFPCSRSLSLTAPLLPYLRSPATESQPLILLLTRMLSSTFSTLASRLLQVKT